jgi:hypothetical protein
MKMNKIRIILPMFLALVLVMSCQDDGHELGAPLDKSEIDFEVTQDFVKDPGGNTVILKNNTPGTVSMWDYGTGRSNRPNEVVQFAFKGDYVIKFSALTAGGVVELDPVTITVTEDNLNYVNDPLWTMLSGGVGHEKTWLLDANAAGESKFFTSPVYFAGEKNVNSEWDGTSLNWTKVCSEPGGADAICFAYEPNYKSDTWVATPADYGSMTFSLIGGPFVTTDHKGISGKGAESGTYFLDVAGRKLTMTDATPLANDWGPNDVVSMNNLVLVSLSENTMQLAAKSKAKPEYLIFNYISKEYSDNWVPEEQPDPNFEHGDQGDILAIVPTKTWKFDTQVPYNWANLEGVMLNPWNSRADIIATGWAPYGDADVANIDGVSITFSQNGEVSIKQDNGATTTGTFVIDEPTNMIKFTGITPNIPIASWVSASTTDQNEWKIVKVERSVVTDAVTGIWFGKRDPNKAEYMVFHFVVQ